jgi:O-antigen biosynthesis protein
MLYSYGNKYFGLISVLMPVFNTDLNFLTQALQSIHAQSFQNWELCIADDASSDPAVREILKSYSLLDGRIKIHFRTENGHISEASNSALALASGEWIALMDHDDLLPTNALQEIADVIGSRPSTRLIYSDEDKINDHGHIHDPYFKPCWNRDLFYSQNFISHLGVYHTPTVRKIGGFRKGMEGAQDYDLALRFIEQIDSNQIYHIPKILYHWRSHSKSTASNGDAKPYAVTAGERAINEHLHRVSSRCTCSHDGESGYRVRYTKPVNEIALSVIILTDGNPEALYRSLDQIKRLNKESRREFLVIPRTPHTTVNINDCKLADGIFVIKWKQGEGLASVLNRAVKSTAGDYIWFLNDRIEGIDEEDLHELISHAARPDIGAVGGLVLYPDGRVHQAGLLLDHNRISVTAFHRLKGTSRGSMGRLTLIQNYSAVSMDCMVIEKRNLLAVGGFDEDHLSSAHLDVDLCLRLKEAGYRTLWTPYAKFMDSGPRFSLNGILKRLSGERQKDHKYMQSRWGGLLKNDPAYNPNLNQKKKDFNYPWPPRKNG